MVELTSPMNSDVRKLTSNPINFKVQSHRSEARVCIRFLLSQSRYMRNGRMIYGGGGYILFLTSFFMIRKRFFVSVIKIISGIYG